MLLCWWRRADLSPSPCQEEVGGAWDLPWYRQARGQTQTRTKRQGFWRQSLSADLPFSTNSGEGRRKNRSCNHKLQGQWSNHINHTLHKHSCMVLHIASTHSYSMLYHPPPPLNEPDKTCKAPRHTGWPLGTPGGQPLQHNYQKKKRSHQQITSSADLLVWARSAELNSNVSFTLSLSLRGKRN